MLLRITKWAHRAVWMEIGVTVAWLYYEPLDQACLFGTLLFAGHVLLLSALNWAAAGRLFELAVRYEQEVERIDLPE